MTPLGGKRPVRSSAEMLKTGRFAELLGRAVCWPLLSGNGAAITVIRQDALLELKAYAPKK
jgi:hypothetical protein